jgi:oxygen-independent coproporphyrinogen III oxidase
MLYAHIPFCHTRCQFCEYTVVDPKHGRNTDVQDTYFQAMFRELDMYSELVSTSNKKLVGFDIGGGTPSMARIEQVQQLMHRVSKAFGNTDWQSIEVSIETTPKIAAAEADKIQAYYDMGIRRISMGVQTTDFAQAKEMNRDDANASDDYLHRAVANIRNAGFRSFNIDLMYGFPIRASRADDPWLKTVRDTIALAPEHVTLYRMRYKGTLMAHLASRVSLQQVNQQEAAARALLESAGYVGLVGKNTFSRVTGNSGCSDYLDKRVRLAVPYIGIGLGAQSFSHHTLSYNLGAVTKRLEQYVRSVELERIPVQDLYHLSRSAAIAKMASVSFYYGGIDLRAFEHAFHAPLTTLFADELDFLLKHRLMLYDAESQRLQMTTLGKQCFGGVVALFYSPSVKNHILNLPGGEEFVVDPVVALESNQSPFQAKPQTPRVVRTRSTPTSTSTSTTTPLRPSSSTSNVVQSPASLACNPSNNVRSYCTSSASHIDVSKPFEFGNILFSGPCNQQCPFCIGHQLEQTPNNLRLYPLRNIEQFMSAMRDSKSSKVIMTGTRTDPQIYKYEAQLIADLRTALPNVHISLHTNGLLAPAKINVFQQYDSCTISINSFEPDTYRKLHGVKQLPDIAYIRANAPNVPIKLSCVLTRDNVHQVESYLERAKQLGIRRLALRHLYNDRERWPIPILDAKQPTNYHQNNPVYDFDGLQVTHWVFDSTSGRSLNLFSDGTLSAEYLLTKAPNQNKQHTRSRE